MIGRAGLSDRLRSYRHSFGRFCCIRPGLSAYRRGRSVSSLHNTLMIIERTGDLPAGNVSKLDTIGSRRSASWKCVQVGHRRIQEICQLGMCPSWTPSDPGDLPAGNVSKLDTGGSRKSVARECVQVGHRWIQEICRPGMCPSWTPSDPGDLLPGNVSKLDTIGSR